MVVAKLRPLTGDPVSGQRPRRRERELGKVEGREWGGGDKGESGGWGGGGGLNELLYEVNRDTHHRIIMILLIRSFEI